MRHISGGEEFRPRGGLLLSLDWRKSMQNSPYLPGLCPASQPMHVEVEIAEYRPAAHGSHVEAPALAKVLVVGPVGHSTLC